MEQNDVDGSDGIFLLLVNFSGHIFVRGADGYRSLKEYKKTFGFSNRNFSRFEF